MTCGDLLLSIPAVQKHTHRGATPRRNERLRRQNESTHGQTDRLVYELYGLREEQSVLVVEDASGW